MDNFKFYGVAMDAMYCVTTIDGKPFVQRIKEKIKSPPIKIGDILWGGDCIGISRMCLMTFHGNIGDNKKRSPELIDMLSYTGRTDWMVGLFLDEKEAEKCLGEKDCVVADPRYEKQTIAVLKAIEEYNVGNEDSLYRISSHPTMVFNYVCR